jgi:hypothetical protein
MRTRSRYLSFLFVVLAVFALSVQPALAETTTTTYSARMNFTSPLGECETRNVFINASMADPASSDGEGQLFVNVQDVDCFGEPFPFTFTALEPLNEQEFRINPDLSQAHLNERVMACADEFFCVTVDIHLTWHAVGDTDSFSLPSGTCTLEVTVQPAIVTGVVKIDGEPAFHGRGPGEMDAAA